MKAVVILMLVAVVAMTAHAASTAQLEKEEALANLEEMVKKLGDNGKGEVNSQDVSSTDSTSSEDDDGLDDILEAVLSKCPFEIKGHGKGTLMKRGINWDKWLNLVVGVGGAIQNFRAAKHQ